MQLNKEAIPYYYHYLVYWLNSNSSSSEIEAGFTMVSTVNSYKKFSRLKKK